MSWVDLFKLAFSVKCFKSCNCSSFFFRVWYGYLQVGRGVSVTMAKASKKGLLFFPVIFLCFFLPAKSKTIWEEKLYWVQANGVWVGCKDGVYWIWGGLGGQNIARTKCGIGCGVGSVFFFQAYFPLPFSFKIGFAGLDLLGLD